MTVTGREDTLFVDRKLTADRRLWGAIVDDGEQDADALRIGGTRLSLDSDDRLHLDAPEDTYFACRSLGRYVTTRNRFEFHVVPDDPYESVGE